MERDTAGMGDGERERERERDRQRTSPRCPLLLSAGPEAWFLKLIFQSSGFPQCSQNREIIHFLFGFK
jgi:hypothetical protein